MIMVMVVVVAVMMMMQLRSGRTAKVSYVRTLLLYIIIIITTHYHLIIIIIISSSSSSLSISWSGGVHQRGDINILLCGDPGTYCTHPVRTYVLQYCTHHHHYLYWLIGTSKSQLLSYVHKLTPRGSDDDGDDDDDDGGDGGDDDDDGGDDDDDDDDDALMQASTQAGRVALPSASLLPWLETPRPKTWYWSQVSGWW